MRTEERQQEGAAAAAEFVSTVWATARCGKRRGSGMGSGMRGSEWERVRKEWDENRS